MEPVKSKLNSIALFFSAALTLAGIAGIVYVVKMGVLPSNNLMGHSKAYEHGWKLFFSLVLGIPCLLAFLGGLTPWIIWIKKNRKKKR